MIAYKFYVTSRFLVNATKESLTGELKKNKHFYFTFQLFLYKVQNQNSEIAFLVKEGLEYFKSGNDYTIFSTKPTLTHTFDEDNTTFEEYNPKLEEKEAIIECASFKSGSGNFEVCIVCCDDEYNFFKEIANEYPIKVLKIEEAIKLLKK